MSDKKISELTALTAPDGAEELVVNDSGTSKKITIDNLITGIDDNATSTAITIDSSENVGIGTTAPQGRLHVQQNKNGANNLIVENEYGANASANLLLQVPLTAGGSSINSGIYKYTSGSMVIANGETSTSGDLNINTANAVRVKINSVGNVMIPNGVTLGNGTTYAAANTLDDYEEGTWTCTCLGQTATATGSYIKIGASVYVVVTLSCDTDVSTTTTSNVIGGLPFAIDNTKRPQLNFRGFGLSGVAGAGGAPTISDTSGPSVVSFHTVNGGGILAAADTSTNPYYRENIFNSGSTFWMAGTYYTA